MSRPVNPIICDGCKKTKGESNAWWTAHHWPSRPDLGFTFQPGTADTSRASPVPPIVFLDFCGVECALRFVSEQMGKQANG